MKPLHVVLLKSKARNQGGLEKTAARIAKAFIDKGARVTILTTESGAHLTSKDLPLSILRTLIKCEKCQGGALQFEPGEAGAGPPKKRSVFLGQAVAAKLKKFSDAGGSQIQWLPDAGRFTLYERSQYIHSVKTAAWPPFLKIDQFDRFVQSWLAKESADLVFGMDRNRMQTHIRAGNGVHDAYLKSRIFTEGRLKYYSCLINPLHRKILRLEQIAFEHPKLKKLFTNSYMVKKEILERFSTDPAKIQVIHNGVEWADMQTDFEQSWDYKPILCRVYGLNPDMFHLLFVGNGYLRKGLSQLLEGMAKLKRDDLHLSVVGKDSRQNEYEAKVHRLGLSGQVRFFGPQQNIRPFYQFADALAIPSFYDPFANVTVEALAMGLYILSSKKNGGSEILTADTGVVVGDLLSTDAMVFALERTLTQSKSKQNAERQRQSVKHLDYSKQMNLLVEACLG